MKDEEYREKFKALLDNLSNYFVSMGDMEVLTVRQHYKIAVIQALLSNPGASPGNGEFKIGGGYPEINLQFAKAAGAIADAMIQEDKENGE